MACIINKPYYIDSIFCNCTAAACKGCPCTISLPPVLTGPNTTATVICYISFIIINCCSIIRNTRQLNCACFATYSCNISKLRSCAVYFSHKNLCRSRVSILIHNHKFIDTIFCYVTASCSHIICH